MIKPSIGRVVWFTPSKSDPVLSSDQKMAALVAYVHSDTCINLAVFDANGGAHSRTSVTLIHDEEIPELWAQSGYYAEWMPFQKGQAAKTEQVEKKALDSYTSLHPQRAPHQQRVLDEKAELDGRLTKLNEFLGTEIYASLDPHERERLAMQSNVMMKYSEILGDRIAAF